MSECLYPDMKRVSAYRRGCRCPACRSRMAQYRLSQKGVPVRSPRSTLAEKLLSKIDLGEGCALWTGGRNQWGYGSLMLNGERKMAHRLIFELQHGPIPEGMFLDHQCYTPACVNPDHLKVVTPGENMENRQGARRDNRTSGVRGVCWDRSKGKWTASAQKDRKKHYAGRFDSLEEAAEAARLKRIELYTNNPQDRRSAA